ncbi:MAG: hypothetical protein QUS14_18490 [Pyrinomonadaceae bacterium]|nr:hypothetical protein [Pyrinomonadaceae bacterium]
MNKKLWVGGYLLSAAVFFFAFIAVAVLGVLLVDEVADPGALASGMIVLGVLGYTQFLIVHTIMTLVLLHSIWKVLQDGVTDVTPGKAIGFLFIPFYNIYWVFRVWGGYPADYNKFIDRYRLAAPKIPGTVFVLFPIFVLLSAILVVPILLLPFVTLFLIARGCDAVNNMQLARAAAEQRTPIAQSAFVGTPENPRSRMPVYALAAVVGAAAIIMIGFGIFAGVNLFPKPSQEVVPAKVGDYVLQPGGRPRGSFLGGKSYFYDYIYLNENGADRKALNYNVGEFRSDTEPKRWIGSMCSTYQPTAVKDKAGAEVGKYCASNGAVFLQHGNRTLRIYIPGSYELSKVKAKEATIPDVLAFMKELPWLKDLELDVSATMVSAAPGSPTTSTSGGEQSVGKDAKPDMTMTGDEFYKATKGKPASSLNQFAGKVIQITARMYSTTGSSVMLMAGKDTFWAKYAPSEASAFAEGKREERLLMKCMAEVRTEVELTRCTLVENKKIISPNDTPDRTYTAEEFWRTVGSYELPSSVRSAKWDELRGKIIKISGNVRAVGNDKANLAAGTTSTISCKPHEEHGAEFDALTDGQAVTFLAVHGVAALENCIVVNN